MDEGYTVYGKHFEGTKGHNMVKSASQKKRGAGEQRETKTRY